MSIKINNQDIVAINKGNQVITDVYKGTDLVWQLVKLGMDDDIYFADPEVGRVLKSKGLIANANKSSKRELATITTLNPRGYGSFSYFHNNKVITKFPELKYCTGLSDEGLIGAFINCSNLIEVGDIPKGVTNMYDTFEGCTSLVNAPNIPESVTNMTSTFAACSNLTEITIPEGVTDMRYTFYGCTNLVNAPVIGESVTDMSQTFYQCSSLVEAPIIPESVTNMHYTFYGCSKLNGIFIIKASTPPNYYYPFENVNVVAIYVPDESVRTYKWALEWRDHSSIIKPMSELPE